MKKVAPLALGLLIVAALPGCGGGKKPVVVKKERTDNDQYAQSDLGEGEQIAWGDEMPIEKEMADVDLA